MFKFLLAIASGPFWVLTSAVLMSFFSLALGLHYTRGRPSFTLPRFVPPEWVASGMARILASILGRHPDRPCGHSTGSLLNASPCRPSPSWRERACEVPARRRDEKASPLRHRVQPFAGITEKLARSLLYDVLLSCEESRGGPWTKILKAISAAGRRM